MKSHSCCQMGLCLDAPGTRHLQLRLAGVHERSTGLANKQLELS